MSDRNEDIYQAASMYYLHGETMENIAHRLDVSRSTVSRMLATARNTGIVRITLAQPVETRSSLSAAIEQRFGVKTHIVSVKQGSSDVVRLDRVARVAAGVVTDIVQPGDVIGVAWGTTLAAVASHLPRRDLGDAAVLQLNGAASPSTSGIPYVGAILQTMAEAWGASVVHFPVPTFFDFVEAKEALWKERSVKRVLALRRRADVAIFGVGTFEANPPSHVYCSGYFDRDDVRLMRSEGVVGDICTVLLRADGTWRDISLNERGTGVTPTELRDIKRRVCIVSGAAKAVALMGALNSGAVTDLIVDDETARTLVHLLRR